MTRTGRDLLRGVTVPMVTPMEAPGRPCANTGFDLLRELHAAGVDALMLLGSNGEGPLLPTTLIGESAAKTTAFWRELPGRSDDDGPGGGSDGSRSAVRQDTPTAAAPVLVNIAAAGTAEVMERAEAVLPAAPDALVLSPPIYFRHREDEIVAHYAACADLGIPIVAYNAPKYSNPITPAVFDALLEMEHVIGIKDSSGDLEVLRHLVASARARRPDFGVGQGAEGALVSGLRAGVDGIVPGIANVAPDAAVALYRAWCAESSLETGTRRRPSVHSAHQARGTNAPSSADGWQSVADELCGIHRIRAGVPAVKAILDDRGLCTPHVAPPLMPCSPEERAALVYFLQPHETHLIRRA